MWGCLPDNSGERLNGIQEVSGSIPLISTINLKRVVTKSTENYGFQCFLLSKSCIFACYKKTERLDFAAIFA